MENILCRYFLHGSCSKGSQCAYAHDLDAKLDGICKYYQSGSCMYGKSCRYDHVKLSKVAKPVIDIDTGQHTSTRAVLLSKGTSKSTTKDEEEEVEEKQWYNATEFVPGKKCHATKDDEGSSLSGLYSEVASSNVECVESVEEYDDESGVSFDGNTNELLCPFAAIRDCPYGETCTYLHGDLCDMCGCLCLHPTDDEQQKEHKRECLAHHEREMELAFAVQRSDGMACSICLDVVKEKADITERVFGLLENCNHAFCVGCIRKWRVSSHMEKTVIRACPICRVTSWFVTPSEFWVEDEAEKTKLIDNYKQHLNTKHCRNFDRGKGVCQFGSSCFYKHVLEDGTVDESKPTIRHTEDSEGGSSVLTTPRLSDFIAARDT